jgi:hypothetical protein
LTCRQALNSIRSPMPCRSFLNPSRLHSYHKPTHLRMEPYHRCRHNRESQANATVDPHARTAQPHPRETYPNKRPRVSKREHPYLYQPSIRSCLYLSIADLVTSTLNNLPRDCMVSTPPQALQPSRARLHTNAEQTMISHMACLGMLGWSRVAIRASSLASDTGDLSPGEAKR